VILTQEGVMMVATLSLEAETLTTASIVVMRVLGNRRLVVMVVRTEKN
jgi:hypothetical protein